MLLRQKQTPRQPLCWLRSLLTHQQSLTRPAASQGGPSGAASQSFSCTVTARAGKDNAENECFCAGHSSLQSMLLRHWTGLLRCSRQAPGQGKIQKKILQDPADTAWQNKAWLLLQGLLGEKLDPSLHDLHQEYLTTFDMLATSAGHSASRCGQ